VPILRIHHGVPGLEAWKRAFDADPLNRRASGVRRYAVYRTVGDPMVVAIDLEFATLAEAEAMLERLRALWVGPGAGVMRSPEAWIVEPLESVTL
jgi:hypothetical protein